MGDDLELLGTHGTSKSRADNIQQGQFRQPKEAGRAGTGIYFWAYENEIDLALELAKLWWSNCYESGHYDSDQHKDCKVICAGLNVDETAFFDTSILYFQEKLFQTARSRGVRKGYQLCKLYDTIIKEIEIALKSKFLVIAANVSRPKYDDSTPMIAGTPSFKCYVVRDHFNDVIVINTIV
ncbi:hypothetical protein [Undibacterium macrobrachii]|uniref:Uncharacterized protein n=1 Tax=Undibacterium macrobrachii TaxID=1119058 RepID=A0ABQ2XET4_9BURK|nr:hypothetical protein [Undibacterium macrobrachii]GGX14011.1 hypothetical protein GCM10011282_20170 [Undibacterium macrobrachii]